MADAVLDASPQPDFGSISNKFGELGIQFGLCANLPAVTQGADLLRSMQQLTVAVESFEQRFARFEVRAAAQ